MTEYSLLFPGQGSQVPGMGRDVAEARPEAMQLWKRAEAVSGLPLREIFWEGDDNAMSDTRALQPALTVVNINLWRELSGRVTACSAAGHSLGEFSALVAAGALSFEEGLRLVSKRAMAMQRACELNPSTMAAVLALPDETVEKICAETEGVVVAANYNCPGQLVISGSIESVDKACAALKAAGAKRAMRLAVGGAFHSPLMEPARAELSKAIEEAVIVAPKCPVYQNVDAMPHTDPAEIKANLIAQLTAPVRWTQSVQHMVADGATSFTELGPGKVLQGLVGKIAPGVEATSIQSL